MRVVRDEKEKGQTGVFVDAIPEATAPPADSQERMMLVKRTTSFEFVARPPMTKKRKSAGDSPGKGQYLILHASKEERWTRSMRSQDAL